MGFGKDGKGVILYEQVAITLGALAARDVEAADANYSMSDDFRIIKSEYYMDYGTQAAGDVIIVGIADGELTAAEIEECIEASPTDRNDNLTNERAMRPVWPLEILGENSTGSGNLLKEGSTSLKWTFSDAEAWQWWAYNLDASNALTTGGIVFIFAKHFGVWVT